MIDPAVEMRGELTAIIDSLFLSQLVCREIKSLRIDYWPIIIP
jgi:hypothetical protein